MTLAEIIALLGQIPSVISLIEQLFSIIKSNGATASTVSALSQHVAAFKAPQP